MAHIDRVTIHRQTIALQRPFVTAVRTAVSVDVLLVEVRDSDGRCGWGEAPTSWRVTGESVESVTAAVSGPLRDAVRGLTSDDPEAASAALERAAVRNSSARMALDCALFDLASQEQGVPLFRYLGAGVAHVRTDMTLSAAVSTWDVESLVRTAVEFAHAGFSTLKIKAGAGGDDARTIIEVRRAVGDDEVAVVRDLLQRFIPDANGALRSTTVCLYTNAPDDHFILDTHPAHPAVFIASPCSGHGFKFSIAIGELIADDLTGEKRRFDLSPFRLARFAAA